MIKSSAQLVQDAKNMIKEVSVEDLKQQLGGSLVLIDVREPNEFAVGHVEGAVNFPRGVLEMQLVNHPLFAQETAPLESMNQQTVYLICRSGARSALAAESLAKMGFNDVVSVAGGMVAWEQSGFTTAK